MFTGLVQHAGRVISAVDEGKTRRFVIDAGPLAARLETGASLACDGVCLTVEQNDGRNVTLFASPETLQRSTLGQWRTGATVNLEPSLRAGDPIGGHFMQGHVDATGELLDARQDSAESWIVRIGFPERLRPWLVEKGSVAVDGISLTVAALGESWFEAAIIPHTWSETNLHAKRTGDAVNIECDILAKQVHQFLTRYTQGLGNSGQGLTMERLQELGF
ncbi:riboflavin synthase [Candidatus Sumerlaeota bacterium]|nr:riboflavin synthase [Candidatus Sumerlaeota bacterium]